MAERILGCKVLLSVTMVQPLTPIVRPVTDVGNVSNLIAVPQIRTAEP
jgi:hypothetical protein